MKVLALPLPLTLPSPSRGEGYQEARKQRHEMAPLQKRGKREALILREGKDLLFQPNTSTTRSFARSQWYSG